MIARVSFVDDESLRQGSGATYCFGLILLMLEQSRKKALVWNGFLGKESNGCTPGHAGPDENWIILTTDGGKYVLLA